MRSYQAMTASKASCVHEREVETERVRTPSEYETGEMELCDTFTGLESQQR